MKKFKKVSETDYLAHCIECDEPLIKVGLFLIHPNNECVEDDGVKTVIQYRKKFDEFQAKYELPEGKIETLIKDYNRLVDKYENTLCRRISKWFTSQNRKAIVMKTKFTKN
jgi:histidinol dehydrogenase